MTDYDDLIGDLAPAITHAMLDPDGLDANERAFANHYASTYNYKRAAKEAGYPDKMAEAVLGRPKVMTAITRRRQAMTDRMLVTVENVTREYARLAFFDPRSLLTTDGHPIPLHELSDEAAAGIAGVDVQVTEVNGAISVKVLKYKLTNKLPALEALGKSLGMFVERMELTGKDGAELIPEASINERARRVAFMLAQALRAKQDGTLTDIV